MSVKIIRLPDIGEGITEAEIVEWLVSVGDRVTEDQAIGSVMTDKAAVEIPSPVTGIVEALNGDIGDVLSVGAEYARIRAGDEDASAERIFDGSDTTLEESVGGTVGDDDIRPADQNDAAAQHGKHTPEHTAPKERLASSERAASPEHAKTPERAASPEHTTTPEHGTSSETPSADTADSSALKSKHATPPVAGASRRQDSRVKPIASPAVRRRAYRSGVPLIEVTGSGPDGRILHEDIDHHLKGTTDSVTSAERSQGFSDSPADMAEAVQETRVIGLRRAIAKKMQLSKQRIPHFSYVEETDVTSLETLRAELNERSEGRHPRLSLLPFVVLAVLRSLTDFPRMNARYDDEAEVIRQYPHADVGIATQTDNGLTVPVIRRADVLDIRSLAAAIVQLADAAREGRLAPADLSGGTITVTSLGALGGIVSTPVINYPQVAIIGVNRIITRPMFQGNDVVPRKLMNLSCSFDHRVVDGYDAARFVQCIKAYIEFPTSLFVPD